MIVVRIWEGLGNQLFQYAFGRKLQYLGHRVYFDVEQDHSSDYSYFYSKRQYELSALKVKVRQAPVHILEKYDFIKQGSRKDKMIYELSRMGLWKYKYIEENNAWDYAGEYDRLRGDYYIKGWFQRPFFFEDIRETLIKEIRPVHKITISKELALLLESPNTVSVHIRKGDYKISAHSFLPVQYYQKAIKYMNEKLDNPQYIFFSTDMGWVKEKLGYEPNYFYMDQFGEFKDFEELMIMSRCSNNIISNSTFSWWAAWLNQNADKTVLAPNGWSGSEKVSDCMLSEDWIRI